MAVVSIADALRAIRAMQNSRLAIAMIIMYDHVILFDQEVEHIWKGHWTFINLLYLANRYYGLVAALISIYVFFNKHLTDSMLVPKGQSSVYIPTADLLTSGNSYHQWEGWTGLIFSILGQIILQVRLYALYSLHKRRKAVAVAMTSGFALCTALCAYLLWRDILRAHMASYPIPGGTFCVLTDISFLSNMYTFWIPIIIYECLLCVLALLPAIQAFLDGDVYFTSSGKLVRVLLRDSVIYFFVITLNAVACLVGARVAQGIYLDAPAGFSTAMTATIGSRLILNIRDARHNHREFVDHPGLPLSHDVLIRSK